MRFKRSLMAMSLTAYLFSASGCGVLLYPERQGQTGGNLDPAVVILNGVGLLFYVIPGLVAFAIDFHQGTIYLPNGTGHWEEDTEVQVVDVEGPMTEENIRAALEKAGVQLDVELTDSRIQVEAINAKHPLMPLLARTQGAHLL